MVPGAVLGAGVLVPGAWCWVHGIELASVETMVARRFEELVAWQLANELKRKVYALVDASAARNDCKFRDQIKDSAASAPRNLAEGFACYRHGSSLDTPEWRRLPLPRLRIICVMARIGGIGRRKNLNRCKISPIGPSARVFVWWRISIPPTRLARHLAVAVDNTLDLIRRTCHPAPEQHSAQHQALGTTHPAPEQHHAPGTKHPVCDGHDR